MLIGTCPSPTGRSCSASSRASETQYAAKVLGVGRERRWRFAFLISQGGELAFVVLGKAGMAQVISEEWGAAMVLSVAISMALTPFIGHYTQLRKLGVEVVERETFESSVKLGREALMALGCPAYEARERADRFRRNNVGMREGLLPI